MRTLPIDGRGPNGGAAKNSPVIPRPGKLTLLAVAAFFIRASGLGGQELDLAFLDKAPGGGVPVFFFENGQVTGQAFWENAPVLSARPSGQKTAQASGAALLLPPCAPCPTIAAIFINGCYNVAGIDPDEHILINSGGGFTMGDLQIDFQSNGGSTANNDINYIFTAGFGTNVGSTPCGLAAGDLSKVTGCANFISATASTVVPPNTLVMLQSTAVNGGTTVINFSNLCSGGNEKCVYVVKNACTRNTGAFSNTASRTTGIAINGCSCLSYNTYPTPAGNDGDYYLPASGTSGTSSPCATAPPVTGFPNIPVLTQPASPLCTSSPYVLPPITGANLTGNQKYYTGTGGTGTAYSAGQSFTFSGPVTLYLFDATVGCVVEKTLQLVPGVTANAGSDVLICPGEAAQLTATGGATYQWSPGAGLSATNIPNPIASPAATTTYTVTATSSTGGCTGTDQVVVTVAANPAATITPAPGTSIDCSTASITLTAGGGGTYQWSTGAGGPSITVTAGGTYTVTATNASGCTGTAAQTISQNNTPPNAAITNNTGTTELNCSTTSISLTATGGGTYLWSNGLGTAATVSVTAAGTYTVTVTGSNGCTATASLVITQNSSLPAVSISTNPTTTVLTCATASIVLTASSTPPGATFSWTIPGGGTATGASVTASVPGTYAVTATAGGGCTAVGNISLTQNLNPPNATVSPATGTVSCNTPTVTLTAGSSTPGATFNWGGGNTSATNTVSAGGTFTVTVTNPANGCTATASSVISQNTAGPGAAITPATVVLTCTDPTAVLTASSGDPGATFNWGNGNLTPTQTVAAAGAYSVTATGANGCTSTATATVTQNAGLPTVSIAPASPQLNCTVSQITLTASSGTPGATFLWNTGAPGATLNVATSGNFAVTVTAPNGCSNSASVLVSQDIDPPGAAVTPATASLNCLNATAVLTASSATPGATFNWGGGNTSTTKTVAAAGTYTVTVTGPNGCTALASASVAADFALPDAAVSPVSGEINCTNPMLTLTASSQTGGANFNWGGGNTSTTKTVAAAGTFTVTVTDPSNGCTATASSVVTQSTAPPTATIAPANPVLTCADPTLMLTASATPAGATFLWPNGSTSSFFFVNAPGTYSVTVTGANGCTTVASKTVAQAPGISSVQVATTQTTCGSATGTITLTPAGGGPFSYDWSGQPGSGSNPRTGLPIGSFTCTVTNSFGCTMEASGTVDAPGAPSVTVEVHPDTCGQMLGRAQLTITGGAMPYAINWGGAPGSGDLLRLGMTVGTFTVTITDANNCTALATVAIAELQPPTVQATTVADFCGQSNGAVFLTVTGDQPPFIINWGGQPGSGSNPRTGLPAGDYEVEVTDAVGCSQLISMTVFPATALPTAAILPANPSISCQDPSVALVAQTTTPNATFLWSNSSNSNTLVATAPGPYSVTVTAPNGCSNSATATVGGSTDAPDVSISPASAVLNCSNPTATLTASSAVPGAAFNWGNGNTNASLSVNSAGNYGVTVTAPNGCTASATAPVTQNFNVPDLTVTPLSGEINCANPSVTLTANAPDAVSFSWNNALNTSSITTTVGGVFSVTITAANGCTNAGGATVSQDNAPPDLVLSPLSGEITCLAPTLNLTAFSAAPSAVFAWTGGATGSVLTVSTGGSYSVTVTSANTCTATATGTIVQNNAAPPLTITPSATDLTCQNPTVTLTANSSPGTGFLWQNGSTSATFTVSAPGSFSVAATGANGCTASASQSIGQILGISSIATTATDPGCGQSNGSVLLAMTGGTPPFSFNWGAAGGTGSNPRTGLGAGSYSATVTDANGCTSTASASLAASIPPTASATATASGCASASGTATVNIAGGTAPFSINWGAQPGTGDSPRTNLPPGTYAATVTDAAGCTATATANVGLAPSPSVAATSVAANCGQDDGSISLTITGGTPAFSINWGAAPGTGPNPRTGLPGGSFTATVTDANGCSASATATVADPGAPSLAFSNTADATCGLPNGSVSFGISGGTPPFNINWGGAPGSGQNPRTALPAGNYPATVTDAKGCTLLLSFEIKDSPPLSDVDAIPTNASCGGQNGSIEVVVTGGTAPLSYNWGSQPGGGGKVRTGLPPGVFTVTVVDAAGCSKTGPPTVIMADPFVTGGTFTTTPTTCGLADGTAFVTPISGVDVFQFKWGTQPGQGSNPRTKLPVGTYTVTIVDGNGCEATASVNILSGPGPVVNTSLTPAGCGAADGAIALQVLGIAPPFAFNWGGQPGSGDNPRTGLPPGTYIATISDANGCTVLQAGEILTDSLFLTTQALPTTCGQPNGQINVQVSGGNPGLLNYDWGAAPGLGSNPRTGLPAGDFTVTVSQNAGCTAETMATVAASAPGPAAMATATPTTCGATDGQISISTTGGTAPLNFDWGGQPGTGQNPRTGLPAGSFTATVTDAAGCSATASATVSAPGAPTVAATSVAAKCGAANGSATLQITGGTGPFAVDWGGAPGSGTTTRTGLPAGNFVVTVTGGNGCSASLSVQVLGNAPLSATASTISTKCGLANGEALLQITNAAGVPTVNWGTAPGTGSNPRTGLPAGSFTVTVTDADGCTATATATVGASTGISVNALTVPTGCGQPTGQVSFTASGGNASGTGYSAGWGSAPGSGQNPRTGLPAGSYFFTVSDSDGCTALGQATVDNADAPVVAVLNTTPANCGQPTGTASLSVSGGTAPVSIGWGAAPGSGQNPRTGLPAGLFTVTATDAAGCTSTVPVAIGGTTGATTHLTATTCDAAAEGIDTAFLKTTAGCDSLVITATSLLPGATFFLAAETCDATLAGIDTAFLKKANGCDSLVITTTVLRPSQALFFNEKSCNPAAVGTDTVFLQNQFGCDSLLITTTSFDAAAADTTMLSEKSCDPSAVGTTQVLLKNSVGCDSLVITSTTLSPTSTAFFTKKSCDPSAVGVDTVFLQNQFGCDSLLITTTSFDAAAADTTMLSAKSCDPSAVGTTQVLLKNAVGCDSLVITSTTLSPASTVFFTKKSCDPSAVGVDTVFLQNQFGCDSLLITTTSFDASAADTTAVSALTCDPSAVGTTQVLLKNAAGCDSLVVTTTALDVAGCAPDFTALAEPPGCHDGADGSLLVQPSQGALPMSFSWLNPSTGATGSGLIASLSAPTTIGGLGPGSYSVTVTSASGATVAKLVDVPNPAAISLTVNVLSDFNGFAVRCTGGADGRAEAVFSGAKPPVNFQWSGGGAAQILDNLPAGPASVTLTDANGCTATAGAVLGEPPPIASQVFVKNVRCAGDRDGSASLEASGGVGPLLFSFENGAFGAENEWAGLAEGSYSIQTEDANGCRDTATATVLSGNLAMLALPIDSAELWSGDTLRLALGGPVASIVWQPPFQVWQSGATEVSFAPLTSLFYEATIIDSNGCAASDGLFVWVKNGRDFFAPNALRPGPSLEPNGFFTLYSSGGVAEIELLQVFDRWGELVFSNKGFPPNLPELGWDGRFHGDFAQPAVFAWHARLRLTDGRLVEQKGGLTVVR